VFQSASGVYNLSNNTLSWTLSSLVKDAATNFTVTVTAPNGGSVLNTASSVSVTPDPTPGNNNGSAPSAKVTTAVTPVADIIVLLSGPPSVSPGQGFTYTVVVTNGGPSASTNVLLKDTLPTNLVYNGSSGGGVISNRVITWPLIVSMPAGASSNFTITVTAPLSGTFTNVAYATAATLDLNPTNNNGTLPVSQAATIVAPAQFLVVQGSNVFNPQTGLFEQRDTVTNSGSNTVAAVRLLVGNLHLLSACSTNYLVLYNAAGVDTNSGRPYVEYNRPLDPGSNVQFTLEFYDAGRCPFTNTLEAQAVFPSGTNNVGTNGVAISREFVDNRIAGQPRFVIEFPTVPGKTYTVIYSDDNMATWQVATPSITANATSTQWYDDGPPKTSSPPLSNRSRFYRVISN
jgi:uncharacterized repeat protein (TIGR01451 family)